MAILTSSRERGARTSRIIPVWAFALALFAPAWLSWRAVAAQYQISLIEKYATNQVLIHFDAPASHTYILEYTGNLGSNGHPSGPWSGLYTAQNLPFFEHYIIVDTRTAKQRFYRLRVTTP